MKKKFAIGGAVIGLIYGVASMIYAFRKVPGRPGYAELLFQIGIVAVLAVFGSILGLFIGWLISLVCTKKNEKSA